MKRVFRIFLGMLGILSPSLGKLQKRGPIEIPVQNLELIIEHIVQKGHLNLTLMDDANLKNLALGMASGLIKKYGLLETSCAVSNQNLRFYREEISKILKILRVKHQSMVEETMPNSQETSATSYEKKQALLDIAHYVFGLLKDLRWVIDNKNSVGQKDLLALYHDYDQAKIALNKIWPLGQSQEVSLVLDNPDLSLKLLHQKSVALKMWTNVLLAMMEKQDNPQFVFAREQIFIPLDNIQKALKQRPEEQIFYGLCCLAFLDVFLETQQDFSTFNALEQAKMKMVFLEFKECWTQDRMGEFWNQPLALRFNFLPASHLALCEKLVSKIQQLFKHFNAQKEKRKAILTKMSALIEEKIRQIIFLEP